MTVALRIFDQTNAEQREPAITLQLASERLKVRDLIERRVREEVERFNRDQPRVYRGLVQPADTEITLNGYRLRKPKKIDWRQQADAAIDAFENGRIYILFDDRQLDTLDDELTVTAKTEVIFLKLVALIGG